MTKYLGSLSLWNLGLLATVDRWLLYVHGHSHGAWVYVYALGYAFLIVLHTRLERASSHAMQSSIKTMAMQNELVKLQQAKIQELERCLSES